MHGIDLEPPSHRKVENVLINGIEIVEEVFNYGIASQTYKNEGSNLLGREINGRIIDNVIIKNTTMEEGVTNENLKNSIYLMGIHGVKLENITVKNSILTGISFSEIKDICMNNITVENCYNMGIAIQQNATNESFDFGKILINGLDVTSCDSAHTNASAAVNLILSGNNIKVGELKVTNSKIYNNEKNGLRITTTADISNLLIDRITSYNNTNSGLLLEGTGKVYGIIQNCNLGYNPETQEEKHNGSYDLWIKNKNENSIILYKGRGNIPNIDNLKRGEYLNNKVFDGFYTEGIITSYELLH